MNKKIYEIFNILYDQRKKEKINNEININVFKNMISFNGYGFNFNCTKKNINDFCDLVFNFKEFENFYIFILCPVGYMK